MASTSSLNVPKAHQELVIASIMKDQYLYSISKDALNDTYFSDPDCKIIYRAISAYHAKYRVKPTPSELLVSVNDYYSEGLGTSIDNVRNEINKLDSMTLPEDDSFIKDKIVDLIRRVRTGQAFSDIYNQVKSNESLSDSDVMDKLLSSMDVDLDEIELYNLADYNATIKSREEALGTTGSPKVVKSIFNTINDNLLYGGYLPGTLNMIVAAPGCFTGDTLIMTPDGNKTIDELMSSSNKSKVYSYSDGKVSISTYDSIRLSKWTDDLVKVNIGPFQYEIKCTPDHPFLTNEHGYVEAKDLQPMDTLVGVWRDDDTNIVKASHDFIPVNFVERIHLDKKVPVYGLVEVGTSHNYAIALSSHSGCIVHNTGKTMFLIEEGSYASLQGYSVLHVFIGDMKKYDAFVRYSSNISRQTQSNVAMMTDNQIEGLITMTNQTHQDALSRIDILAYDPGTKTVGQLVELIHRVERKFNKDYDVIIIDYPENLKRDPSMSLYTEGGEIYDKLVELFWTTKSVGLVASQPKVGYWNQEIIPLEGAAESSRKQHAADMMMCMGLPFKGSEVGTLFLPKVRRGNDGVILRFKRVFSESRFEEISEATYKAYVQNSKLLQGKGK